MVRGCLARLICVLDLGQLVGGAHRRIVVAPLHVFHELLGAEWRLLVPQRNVSPSSHCKLDGLCRRLLAVVVLPSLAHDLQPVLGDVLAVHKVV